MSMPPPFQAGQQPRFFVDVAVVGGGDQVGHLHGHDLLRRQLADAVQRSARHDDVPDVQHQADARRGDHVHQQREGVHFVNELEGVVLAEDIRPPENRRRSGCRPARRRGRSPGTAACGTRNSRDTAACRSPARAWRRSAGSRRRRPPGRSRAVSSCPWRTARRRFPNSKGNGNVPSLSPIFSAALSNSRRA